MLLLPNARLLLVFGMPNCVLLLPAVRATSSRCAAGPCIYELWCIAHSSQGCSRSTSSIPSASADAAMAGSAAAPACLAAAVGWGAGPCASMEASGPAVRAVRGLLTWLWMLLSRSSASEDSMLLASLGEKEPPTNLPAAPGATPGSIVALPAVPAGCKDGAGAAACGCRGEG